MRRWFLIMGCVFLALTLVTAAMALQIGWSSSHDFDVTGLLALFLNLPGLFLWGLTILFAGLAGYCFIHGFGWRSSRLSRLSSEEQRLMADPRFMNRPER